MRAPSSTLVLDAAILISTVLGRSAGAIMEAQRVSALNTTDRASAAHPWIERDPSTGAQAVRIPLPPPDVARRLADALVGFAGLLRGGSG